MAEDAIIRVEGADASAIPEDAVQEFRGYLDRFDVEYDKITVDGTSIVARPPPSE